MKLIIKYANLVHSFLHMLMPKPMQRIVDKHIGVDKQKHAALCAGVSLPLLFLLTVFTRLFADNIAWMPHNIWLNAAVSAQFTFIGVTLVKEIWNDLIRKRGQFEFKDIAANFIGSNSLVYLLAWFLSSATYYF